MKRFVVAGALVGALVGGAAGAVGMNAWWDNRELPTSEPYPFGVDVEPQYVRIEVRTNPDGSTQVCATIDAPKRYDTTTGQPLPAVSAHSCEAPRAAS